MGCGDLGYNFIVTLAPLLLDTKKSRRLPAKSRFLSATRAINLFVLAGYESFDGTIIHYLSTPLPATVDNQLHTEVM